jgi:hypothetical protein
MCRRECSFLKSVQEKKEVTLPIYRQNLYYITRSSYLLHNGCRRFIGYSCLCYCYWWSCMCCILYCYGISLLFELKRTSRLRRTSIWKVILNFTCILFYYFNKYLHYSSILLYIVMNFSLKGILIYLYFINIYFILIIFFSLLLMI